MVELVSTRNLAIYASIIGTLNGLWALYVSTLKDRPRIKVSVSDVKVLDQVKNISRPAVEVTVANRGRRPVTIKTIAFDIGSKGLIIPIDFVRESEVRLEEGQSKNYIHYQDNPKYKIPKPYRPIVRDATDKKHPLRYRWAVRWRKITLQYWREKRKQI